jgi:DNA replication ATP-dependent helicase Dna2
MKSSPAALLQRLRRFVHAEVETQRSELHRRWALPLAERVGRGRALVGLQVEKVAGEGLVRLHCDTNESRFREGDLLVLHRGDPIGLEAVQCLLEYDDETILEVTCTSGNIAALLEQRSGWIADESILDLSRFYLEALDDVADTVRGRELILPLLGDEKRPTLDFEAYQRSWENACRAGLNESQCEAVAQAYASDLFHLIQGPPGTGKTLVLAHLVRQLVADGQRVLVTALTHRAINNALNKIAQVDTALPACKIGIETRTSDLKVENYRNFALSGFGDMAGGYAIGATPFATRSERLSGVEFDVVVFDEASQVTLPLAIMGMLAGVKYVFIGDERQLPPVTTLSASQLGRASVFGYLCGRGCESLLNITYRLNTELADWPSRKFYEGAIVPSPEAAKRRLKLDGSAAEWRDVLDPEKPLVFMELDHCNCTVKSHAEAEIVAELVRSLAMSNVALDEIGVVTPYRAQGRLIRNRLRAALEESGRVGRGMYHDLVVDTVERMQGQEREVVLVSLTTSSPAFAEQLAEFYFQPERLNVAITRPRTKLIIVGSRRVLQAQPEDPEHLAWVALLNDLVDHCHVFKV